jgi:hypothetical protein
MRVARLDAPAARELAVLYFLTFGPILLFVAYGIGAYIAKRARHRR